MPRRLLACLVVFTILLAATPARAVSDPSAALNDALDLLATLRDSSGNDYPTKIRALGVTFNVVPLPAPLLGAYQQRTNRILLSDGLFDEDATVMAAVIAHELQHASDAGLVAFGFLPNDCIELEVRA